MFFIKKSLFVKDFIKLRLSASIYFEICEAKFSILSKLLNVTLTGIFLNLKELIISLLLNPFLISYLPAFIFSRYLVLYAALLNVEVSFIKVEICFLKLSNPVPDLI